MSTTTSPFGRVIVFDLETGGTNAKTDAITEIAMVVVDFETLEVVDTYEAMILPYEANYTADAEKVSKITQAMLIENGKDVLEVAEEVKDFIKKHTINSKKPMMAGHNIIKFDYPFMQKWLSMIKENFEKLTNPIVYDTIPESKKAFLKIEKYNLGECCRCFGIVNDEAHRAMADTQANAKLVIKLLEAQRGVGATTAARERKRVKFEL